MIISHIAAPCMAAALAVALCLLPAGKALSQTTFENSLSPYFGFSGMEVYKGSRMMRGLRHSDVNGDGRDDITCSDPEKSQILIMAGGLAPDTEEGEINSVAYDGNFRAHRVSLEKNVYDYEFLRLPGDTAETLFIVSEPRTVVVMRQTSPFRFEESARLTLDESNYSKCAMARADLDGDSDEDLLIMAPDHFIGVFSEAGRAPLADIRYFPIASDGGDEPAEFSVADANGDGYSDLVYCFSSRQPNLRVKYGSVGGMFHDEEAFELLNFRNMDWMSGSGEALLACVLENSNKIHAWRAVPAAAPAARAKDRAVLGTLSAYYSREDRNSRPIVAAGDLDADGMCDVIAANGQQGSAVIYGYGRGGVSRVTKMPCPAGVTAVASVEAAPGLTTVYYLSPVGVSCHIAGVKGFTPPFPEPVPALSKAICIAPVRDAAGKGERLFAIVREDSVSVALTELSGGKFERIGAISSPKPLENISAVVPIASRDGVFAFVAFPKYDQPAIYVRQASGAFAAVQPPDKNTIAAPRRIVAFDHDGDGACELVTADRNIVRIFAVSPEGVSQKDQVNVPFEDFSAACMAASSAEIFILDGASKKLASVKAGARSAALRDIDRRIQSPSLLSGPGGRLVVHNEYGLAVFSDRPGLVFEERQVAGYEEIKNGAYNNLLLRDANADGVSDIIATCGAKNVLDIFTPSRGAFRHAFRFKIFNSKHFNSESYSKDPEMIDTPDADGDGAADLSMLVHDKLMIYYSDTAAKHEARKASRAKKEAGR